MSRQHSQPDHLRRCANPTCDREFSPDPTNARRGGGRFCSRRCHGESRRVPLAVRFWEKVSREGTAPAHRPELGSCWNWTASVSGTGYGELYDVQTRRPHHAHRISWVLHQGEVPRGLFVLHRCDNRLCVRPSHLMLGTNDDNVADMMDKQRNSPPPLLRGERNPKAKLTPAIVH